MSNQNYRFAENEPEKISTRLLYISEARYDTDWQSVPHSHHFTEIFYVLQGEGGFLIENDSFPVRENDLIIINPNVLHTETCHSGKPLKYIVLGISGLYFKSEKDELYTDYNLYNFAHYRTEIDFYLKTLLREIQTKEGNYEEICQNLLEILIWNIVRRTKTGISAAPAKKITRECRFIEEYLDEHFKEDITLQTLCNLTYLNKYYLVHAFKKYKGVSPINYLIGKRIDEAKHLLETTNFPVAKIASSVGFSSQSYFSQIFKKETGETPNSFRKNCDNNKK